MNDAPLFPELQAEPSAAPDAPGAPTVVPVVSLNDATASAPVPDLFGQPTPTQTPATATESGVVNAVMSQNDPEKGQILGPKPKTSAGLDVRARQFNFGAFLFKFSVILGVLVFGFFHTQLSETFTWFGANPTQELISYEASFQDQQSSINLYNLLITKFALDDFTTAADSFLVKNSQYESDYTATNELAALDEDLADLQKDMNEALTTAQERLRKTFYPRQLLTGDVSVVDLEDSYISLLKLHISDEKQALRGLEDEESLQEVSNLEGALALLNARDLTNDVKALDLTEDLAIETVESLFTQTTAISKDQTSTILAIRNGRVNWESILDEVENVTKKIDPLFGSGIPSNIEYSNLSFNLASTKGSVRGETRTDDTLNFSLISDLVDQLELSTYFADVTTRSFSKSESSDDDFSASFSLEMTMQAGDDDRDAVATVIIEEEEEVVVAEEVEEEVAEEAAEEETFDSGATNMLNVLKELFFGDEDNERKPVPRS